MEERQSKEEKNRRRRQLRKEQIIKRTVLVTLIILLVLAAAFVVFRIVTDKKSQTAGEPKTTEPASVESTAETAGSSTPADVEAPVFSMAENFTAYLGDSIKFKEHVAVSDDSGAYDLQVDTSRVVPNKPGDYEVIYTATDAAGNSSSKMVILTLLEKTPNMEELNNRVDAILADLITDDMTQREKAEAIYYYIYYNFYFVDESNKEDYVIAALDMLNNGQGDCFSFFAIAKAMLTRAGIKNMDIYTPPDVHEHYWNLVDIEDGHGWYHYDTTRWDSEIHVFLWEDADLEPYNDGRWDYNRGDFPPIA